MATTLQRSNEEQISALSGPKAKFRGKLRDRPLTLALTEEGRQSVIECALYNEESRTDYIERLARADRDRLRKKDPNFDRIVRARARERIR
jgi:hypothetical protein